MINITINQQPCVCNANLLLKEILAEQSNLPAFFAVVVNNNFIPKVAYSQIMINDGDVIQFVTPMQGG